MSEPKYIIRQFDPACDMEAAIDCYESGFGASLWPIFKHSRKEALVDMVMTDYRSCEVTLVAEAGGRARGLLFGNLPTGLLEEAREVLLTVAFMLRRLLWRRGEMEPIARAALWRAISREALYYIHTPRGKAAEIGVLTSQEGWRGGIGRALMDAFVEEVRSRGVKRVDLGSDSELAWGFYEKYGFERVASWPHHAYDYSLPGREVTAYIYSLVVTPRAGTP